MRRAALAQGKAVFGHVDGRLQHLREGHRAPAIEQDVPRVDDAGQPPESSPSLLGILPPLFFLYHSIVASFGARASALIE